MPLYELVERAMGNSNATLLSKNMSDLAIRSLPTA
jgi:hypothetical protein